ncbi:hypothetical protein BC826DRAFT_722299 [Russula brevipes]|nr:hypothetical protein BC826DRAFT_722299 [Russula brevipes]
MSTSTSNQGPATSTSNFVSIFQTAYEEYKALTRQDLDAHPFAAELDQCNSPEAISNLLQKQAHAFIQAHKGNEKLLAWLDPTVHVLFTFSATLGEGVGLPFPPAKTIFTGIAVLLGTVKDTVASYATLISVFERVHLFLKRLRYYTGIPLTPAMTELLGNIMAQVLSILALSTKAMKERRIKKFLKRLVGRKDVEDALLRLDTLTKEEALMTAARNLEVAHHIDDNVNQAKDAIDQLKRNHSRGALRSWLFPPNPSINHNVACDTLHDGTARWFVQGRIFEEWKMNGSLLWIRGNPGSGKSILCSAIIEDIKRMRLTKPALIAYYYLDFKDIAKRDIRGLLSSLLTQLGDDSDQCWTVLSKLYTSCRDGADQPSESALAQCLQAMLELPGQVPVYIIIDALDESPNTTGTPSARKKVLDFVKNLIGRNHPNLFMCITKSSRARHSDCD